MKRASILALIATLLLLTACGANGNKAPAAATPAPSAQGTVATAGTVPPGPPAKMTVAYIGAEPVSLSLFIAKDGGIFQKHGLDVDLQVISGATSIAALVSGQIQSASGGSSDILGANVSGADLVVVGVLDPSFPGQLYASPRVKSPADLKGKKIAITNPGGSFDVVAREALPKMGLQPDKDVSFVATGSIANAVTALLNGAVDASPVQTGPDSVKLEAAGFHPIYDLTSVHTAGAAITLQRSYIAAHHDVVQRYIDSLVEAIAKEKTDKAFTVQMIKKYLTIDDGPTQNAIYSFFTQESVLPSLPYPKPEYFTIPLNQLSAKNEKARGYDATKMLDQSFVQSAADRHLDK